jgi:hypothetical protein
VWLWFRKIVSPGSALVPCGRDRFSAEVRFSAERVRSGSPSTVRPPSDRSPIRKFYFDLTSILYMNRYGVSSVTRDDHPPSGARLFLFLPPSLSSRWRDLKYGLLGTKSVQDPIKTVHDSSQPTGALAYLPCTDTVQYSATGSLLFDCIRLRAWSITSSLPLLFPNQEDTAILTWIGPKYHTLRERYLCKQILLPSMHARQSIPSY